MKKNLKLILFCLSLLIGGNQTLKGQEISAIIKDSITKEIIPYASVYLSSGKGILSNEEGRFRLVLDTKMKSQDSLYISCMGYKTLGYPVTTFRDSIILLPSKAIALGSITVSYTHLTLPTILRV